MRNRTRMIAAVAAVAAALAASGGAALASTTGAKPGATTKTAGAKSAEERQGHAAIVAAVAQALHVRPSRSRWRNSGPGCAPCCGAAARAPACLSSLVSSLTWQHIRRVAAVNGCR